jgi:hypothetical protein
MKLTNITPENFRCSIGACPAVYTDLTPAEHRCPTGECPAVLNDDSENFVFIGVHIDPVPEELSGKVGEIEAAVRLPAKIVLASLGVTELVEAAERSEIQLSNFEAMCKGTDRTEHANELAEALDALRSAIKRAKGGE